MPFILLGKDATAGEDDQKQHCSASCRSIPPRSATYRLGRDTAVLQARVPVHLGRLALHYSGRRDGLEARSLADV